MKKLGLIIILLACLVVPGALAYTGPVNITGTPTVDDARVDPNQTITWTIPGIYNGTTDNPVQNGFALDFNGSLEYVRVADSVSLSPTKDISISCWIKLNEYKAAMGVVWKHNANYQIQADGANLQFIVYDSVGSTSVSFFQTSLMPLGVWHHITGVYGADNQTRLYLNGTAIGTVGVVRAGIRDQAGDLIIGARGDLIEYFNGTIDEVLVYDRGLGTGEILYNYQNKVPLNQSGLVLWTDFDTNVLDQSPNGNDGALNGDPEYIRGIRGKADIVFDGAEGRLAVTDDVTIDNLYDGGGTASVWINPYSDGELNLGRIFSKIEGNGWIFYCESELAGFVRLVFVQDFDNTDGRWFTNRIIPINTDSQLVLLYNNDNVANNPAIYVDGVNVTIVEQQTPIGTRISDVGQVLYIGNRANRAVTWNGSLDEIRLYDRTITTEEIEGQTLGIYLNDTGLVLHLDFDGNTLDTSGEGNNADVFGPLEYSDGWAFVPVSTSISGQASLVNSSTGLMTLTQSAPATAANYTNVNITAVGATQNQTYALFQVDLYNIDVGALYTEVEATFQTLIYANGSSVLDGHVLTDGDTLIINGVTLAWNNYMGRFEGTTTSAIPAIITFDTLTSLIEATYTITNGNITSAPTVVWTTDKLTLLTPFLRAGDWPGAIIQINTLLIGETIFWTLLLTTISIGIYNFSGPEVALLTWMFGWSMFGAVIHSQALTISLILMAIGGGVYIAKFFLDRRTSV